MYWAVFRRLLTPLLLLLASLLLRSRVSTLDPLYQQLLQFLPYALLGIVMFLCLNYNRSRLFIACLSLFLVYYLVQSQLQTSLTEPFTLSVFSLLSVLQPFFLLQLMFIPERGLLNRYGLLLTFSLLLTFLAGLFLLHYYPVALEVFISRWFAPRPFPGIIISSLGLLSYLLLLSLAVVRLYKRNDDYALLTFSIALFSMLTLARLDLTHISMVMFIGLALSLIVHMLGLSYDMAYRDELTGLLGRRALNDRMNGLAGRYVIAMMDVDHFKKFNDTHGHDIGDEVLKMVAGQIGMVEGGGTAYRYGGEEFCIVFNGRDIDYCRPYLEDVRLSIEEYQMKVRDTTQRSKSKKDARERRGRRAQGRDEKIVSVTISIGVAEPGEKYGTAEEVIKAADKALYRAKKKGRNCLSL